MLPILNQATEYKPQVKRLLTTKGNTKLEKTRKSEKVIVASLTLRPAHKVKNAAGKTILNTCAWATSGCSAVCVLEHAGCSVYSSVKDIRDKKTEFLAFDQAGFIKMLKAELTSVVKYRDMLAKKSKKKKRQIFVRLNTASDIEWEKEAHVFNDFPQIQFYDYTKGIHRMEKDMPNNYHLTYSFNENSNVNRVCKLLDSGRNVAVVINRMAFGGRMEDIPSKITLGGKEYNAIDGDRHDLRVPFLDGQGNVIILRSKGGRPKMEAGIKSGFVMKID